MEQTKREVELKTDLIGLMHKYKKTSYVCGDVDIKLVPEGEKVKVKIRKDDPAE